MADNTLPPIPNGYTLMQPQQPLPPIPDGYQLMQPGAATPPSGGPLQTLDDFNTGVSEDIPFKNELMAGIATPFISGYKHFTGGDDRMDHAYYNELARLHREDTDANTRSPIASTIGNVAGIAMAGPAGMEDLAALAAAKATAATDAMTPASRFARLWANAKSGTGAMAKSAAGGGAYGGALGASNAMDEGGDFNDVLNKSESGAMWGAGAGALGVPIGGTIGAVGDNVIAPVVRTVTNRGKQAAMNVGSYLSRDASTAAGKEIPARGLTDAEFDAAQNAGYPVINAHRGGENVMAATRAAVDQSPEAASIIKEGPPNHPELGMNSIHQGQMDRYAGVIDSFLPQGGAQAAREEAITTGQNQVKPLYDKAYANPNAQNMYNEGFEQMMQSPLFQGAMKGALKTSQDEAALAGANVVLPKFVYRDMGDGTKRLVWPAQEGNPTPSLPFWNEVKKNLDDVIGDNTDITGKGNNTANLAYKLKKNLLSYTDMMVPEYPAARQAAGRYLGESNAFDAGTKLYSQANGPKLNVDTARTMINDWTPPEREAAGSAYLDALKNDLLSKARNDNSGSADLSLNFMKSQKAQQVGNMLLGPDVMGDLNAHNSIERLMASRRTNAIGNSQTNKFQLAREMLSPVAGAGALGAGGLALTGDTDWRHLGPAALFGMALKHGGGAFSNRMRTILAPEIASRLAAHDNSAYLPALRAAASDPTTMGWMRLLTRGGTGAAAQYGAQ